MEYRVGDDFDDNHKELLINLKFRALESGMQDICHMTKKSFDKESPEGVSSQSQMDRFNHKMMRMKVTDRDSLNQKIRLALYID